MLQVGIQNSLQAFLLPAWSRSVFLCSQEFTNAANRDQKGLQAFLLPCLEQVSLPLLFVFPFLQKMIP